MASLLSKAKKWERNRRQTTMKKCYSFQNRSDHSTRKLVLQMPLETTRLENAQIFRKIKKHLLPISSVSSAVSMTTQGCVAAELRRRCRRPAFTTHSSNTRRRMDFGLVAFFQSKTALSTVKVSFLGKLLL